jgi:hypothetical protein
MGGNSPRGRAFSQLFKFRCNLPLPSPRFVQLIFLVTIFEPALSTVARASQSGPLPALHDQMGGRGTSTRLMGAWFGPKMAGAMRRSTPVSESWMLSEGGLSLSPISSEVSFLDLLKKLLLMSERQSHVSRIRGDEPFFNALVLFR